MIFMRSIIVLLILSMPLINYAETHFEKYSDFVQPLQVILSVFLLIFVLVQIILLLSSLFQKQYASFKRGLKNLIIIALALSASSLYAPYIDLSRFYTFKKFYQSEMASREVKVEGKTVSFLNWGAGGGSLLSASSFFLLVYEQSDTLKGTINEIDYRWRDKVPSEHQFFFKKNSCRSSITPLTTHYYIIQKIC